MSRKDPQKRKLSDALAIQSDSVNSIQETSLQPPKKRGRPRKNRERSESSLTPGHITDDVQLAVRATAISSNSSWGGAQKLQHLELDDALVRHIKYNTEKDALSFLNDQTSLDPVHSQALEPLTPLEALTDCFLSANILRQNNVLGAVRYLFRILLIGDIVVTIYGRKGNIKDEQLNELRDFVSEKYEKMNDKEKRSVGLVGIEEPTETLLMNLKTVARRGTKLVGFCRKFGTGSLFWLHSIFSDNL